MKKVFGPIVNAVLSIILGIAAVYVISFLNMVPNSMQVDLLHYMYPKVMPVSGTDAHDAEKARERLSNKLHKKLVEVGLEEEETKEPDVPTPKAEAGSTLTWRGYQTFAKPLGYSLVQEGYYTVGVDGEADKYYSPGPDGGWYSYDPKSKELSEASAETSSIPCSYEDLITFWISRDPSASVSSDMAEILTESAPAEDLKELATYGVKTFGNQDMTGLTFASLLQYQASGYFLGFYDETRSENQGRAFYLSGEDRQYINRVSYNTLHAETSRASKDLHGEVISTVMDGSFYTFDPDTRMIGKISFWPDDKMEGLSEKNIASIPDGYTVPPVIGKAGKMVFCAFAGDSDVQRMDLASGEIREIPELALAGGAGFAYTSFVFGTDRLVIFYTTNQEPGAVKVSEVLYSSLEG